MDERQLLERYEALGNEHDFLAAKPLFERALAERPDADLLLQYGYLLECHGRNELRQAVAQYEQAIELDPHADKPVYQLISAYSGLREPERAVALCETRLAAAPSDLREHRFLASAYLLGAEKVIAIDRFPYRLDMAKERAGAAETINYEQVGVREALLEMTGGRGPDKCIDAVGMEAHGHPAVYAWDIANEADNFLPDPSPDAAWLWNLLLCDEVRRIALVSLRDKQTDAEQFRRIARREQRKAS